MSQTVALVLDSFFGDKLSSLAKKMPVWIIKSPTNDAAVAALRASEWQITTLFRQPEERVENMLVRALIAIEQHHGADSLTEPYDAVDVYGVNEAPPSDLMSELGFNSILPTANGFQAKKKQ
jgi:hypothetical protein